MSSITEQLRDNAQTLKNQKILDLFEQDPNRVQKHSIHAAGLYVDFSKNPIDDRTLELWQQWLDKYEVSTQIDEQWQGKHVNTGEDRPALHHVLRSPTDTPFIVDGQNISENIAHARQQMQRLSDEIRQGQWTGYDGQKITDVIHIGIGGSELGPRLLCSAFDHLADGPRIHFLATPDPIKIQTLQKRLNPATTLLIIASKTFTTEETLSNANFMRDWLRAKGGKAADKQMIAISAHVQRAVEFGIDEQHILPFWDWVGGRFSMWSAIAMPFIIQNGYQAYADLLHGAHNMDEHFRHADMQHNIPLRLALLDAWYNHYWHINNRAVITYAHPLEPFPSYLQQLEMESLGKRSHADGTPLHHPSGMIIWGGTGTEAQHAFFQLIHQGQRQIPLDFITIKTAPQELESAKNIIHAHCLAQSEALMKGRTEEELETIPAAERYQRTCPGNRPSTTIILDDLTPQHLGALIAAYEHKTSVCALLYGINAYDQWGVELGKILSKNTKLSLQGVLQSHDPSTTALIKQLK